MKYVGLINLFREAHLNGMKEQSMYQRSNPRYEKEKKNYEIR
jgi:hypothetical protein